ncbi:MAG: electron transfer flavoprotein subunit alpha/FixB family protein [Thermoplasmata archaeon]|nr:electron transfer flavoprotein subunit alpha/FixB family protein [Thermoplasmata archaeon]
MKAMVFSEKADLSSQMLTLFRNTFEMDLYTTSNENLLNFGAKNVFKLTGNNLYVDNISEKLAEMYKNNGYDIIIIGSSAMGREISSLLSEILHLEAITEVMKIEPKDGIIATERFFYGGKTVIREESEAKIFTVLPGLVDPQPVNSSSTENNISIDKDSAIKVVDQIEKPKSSVNLEKADIIVSAGRGIGKKEGLAVIQQLADVLHGEVGGSRPVCLDYHWLSEERQVGLSGKRVKPKVYVACGISGQVQHIAGMRGSRMVIAINKDKNAPIFNECDYGIVGDLYAVIPKLIEAMKK